MAETESCPKHALKNVEHRFLKANYREMISRFRFQLREWKNAFRASKMIDKEEPKSTTLSVSNSVFLSVIRLFFRAKKLLNRSRYCPLRQNSALDTKAPRYGSNPILLVHLLKPCSKNMKEKERNFTVNIFTQKKKSIMLHYVQKLS